MPVTFKEYIESLEDSRLFVTTTDKRIAKLYPILVWKENEIKLKVLALENLLHVVPFLLVFASFSLYVPTHTHSQNHAKDLISLAS